MTLRFAKPERRRISSPRSDLRLLHAVHETRTAFERADATELAAAWDRLRNKANQANQNETLATTTALGIEVLRRTTGLMAYDVQILAGIALSKGAIAEMQTGEGKTLTTLFPILSWALDGRGVHVATVNAYLARRDFQFLQPPLAMLGISSGISESGASPGEKKAAYQCDVTFATGSELGFDFLRDQIEAQSTRDVLGGRLRRQLFGDQNQNSAQTQRGFAAAIVDEVDSVFVDEATTPLVLSSGGLGSLTNQCYLAARTMAATLKPESDFSIDVTNKTLALTQRGIDSIYDRDSKPSNLNLLRPWHHYIESALRASHIMQRDEHYVVRDDAVQIVDEYTGRIFSDRNWRDGLHQAVEAKEEVTITEERKTIARISRQRYFQRYDRICGMTGTADGHQREFKRCYRVPIVVIPRRKPLQRIELPTRYFRAQAEKLDWAVADAIRRSHSGQPVLIGTRTIGQSRDLAERFTGQKHPFQLLNGVQDQEESLLIAKAGQSETIGCITIATNMAGRGTDIKPDQNALAAGGLHVIGLERNSSARIDRQLLGRAGRQGDPGSGQFLVSADDNLLLRYGKTLVRKIEKIREAVGIESRSFDVRIQQIQKIAEKESYQQRQSVMREELWLDKIKKLVG